MDKDSANELAAQAVRDLRSWHGNGDIEIAHHEADKLLVKLIRSFGYDDVADAWEAIEKWYA